MKYKLNHYISPCTSTVSIPIVAAAPGAPWVLSECLFICGSHCLAVEHNDINIIINITIVKNKNSILKSKCHQNTTVQRPRLNDLFKVWQVLNSETVTGSSVFSCPIRFVSVVGNSYFLRNLTFLPLGLDLNFGHFRNLTRACKIITCPYLPLTLDSPSASGLNSVRESLQN